jgi:hypothetical protein
LTNLGDAPLEPGERGVGGLFDEGREIGVGWKKLCFALGGTELCLFLEVGMFWGWRVGKFVRGTKVMTVSGWSVAGRRFEVLALRPEHVTSG